MNDLEKWNKCVAQAKRKLGVYGYGVIKGAVLKEAQRAYCAIQINNSNK
jgi:hypothetical protein